MEKTRAVRTHLRGLRIFRAVAALGVAWQLYDAGLVISRDISRIEFPVWQVIIACMSAATFFGAHSAIVETLKHFPLVKGDLDLEPSERKRRAKRHNEHLKLAATFSNQLAAAILLGFFVNPLLRRSSPAGLNALSQALAIAASLHIIGHALLRGWRSED